MLKVTEQVLSTSCPGFTLSQSYDDEKLVELRTYRHEVSGLNVHFVPLRGRSARYVGFLVPFGANTLSFRSHDGETVALPAGCAHYLEHCVFSRDEEGGLLGRLSALGADANAYTTYTHTLYYMTCVGQLQEAFQHLYRAVFNPKIDAERVAVERGIIAAEFAMYQDDPDVFMYQSLMEKLFAVHPQRYDICGTKESIQEIRAEDLQRIVRAYYQPNQIEICFAGDVAESEQLTLVAELLEETKEIWQRQDFPEEIVFNEPEKPTVSAEITHLQRQVGVPSFLLGVKDSVALPQQPLDPRALLRKRLSSLILAEIFLGEGSDFYQNLLDEGLINDTFSYQYLCEADCACWILGGESHRPQEVIQRLREYLPTLSELDLDEEQVRAKLHLEKRAVTGSFWKSLDSVSSCGSTQLRARLMGLDLPEHAVVLSEFCLDATVFNSLKNPADYVILTMSEEKELSTDTEA